VKIDRTLAAAALAAAIVVVPGRIQAQDDDTSVSVTNTLQLEYRLDNKNKNDLDDDYGTLLNRMNLSGNSGGISTQLRIDSTGFLAQPEAAGDAYQDDTRIERLTVQYDLDTWQLTGGDYYHLLGRGFALSVRKVDEVGLDIAIRGGKAQFDKGDHEGTLFAGESNPGNTDSVGQFFVEDARDIFAGGDYRFSGFNDLTLGTHALYFQPRERLLVDEGRDKTIVGGVTAQWDGLDWLSVFVEADVQQRELASVSDEGYVGYTQLDMNFGDLTFLVEGMYTDAFELRGSTNTSVGAKFSYNQAPTLERVDQEVVSNRDVKGGRLRAEYYLEGASTLVFANGMFRRNEVGEDADPLDQVHAYAGFESAFQDGAARLNASGGWRDETQGDRDVKSMVHGEMDYVQPVGGGYALHVADTTEYRTFNDENYFRGSTFLGLEKSGLGSFTLEWGYDTQNTSTEVRNIFWAGILGWEATDDITVRATGGTQRGGLKCVAGVCRIFPAFAGVKTEIVGRF
jgi:hypothetical protein